MELSNKLVNPKNLYPTLTFLITCWITDLFTRFTEEYISSINQPEYGFITQYLEVFSIENLLTFTMYEFIGLVIPVIISYFILVKIPTKWQCFLISFTLSSIIQYFSSKYDPFFNVLSHIIHYSFVIGIMLYTFEQYLNGIKAFFFFLCWHFCSVVYYRSITFFYYELTSFKLTYLFDISDGRLIGYAVIFTILYIGLRNGMLGFTQNENKRAN